MGEYKRFIQNQLKKVKSTASDFISSRSNDKETIELELHAFEKLKEIAETQNSSVQAILSRIVDQYFASPSIQSVRITTEEKEQNPLLHLDALCKFQD